jgi:hypothetical protein
MELNTKKCPICHVAPQVWLYTEMGSSRPYVSAYVECSCGDKERICWSSSIYAWQLKADTVMLLFKEVVDKWNQWVERYGYQDSAML